MPNRRIAAFLEDLCRAVRGRDVPAMVDAAEFPHVAITDTGSHVLATPADLFGFLTTVMDNSGTVLSCSADLRDVRPYGPDLFFVEYELRKETAELGRADDRRQFTILRQTEDGFRCLSCYYALDATAGGLPQPKPRAA